MIHFSPRLAALALLAGACATPCFAESSVVSSASESVSTSSAKISDSLTNSSNSSSKGNPQAVGQFKVIDVAEVDGQPGMLRLQLQPLAQGGDTWQLVLPRDAVQQGHVARDVVVTATQRPYGIAFASGDPHQAFFLALTDEWDRELKTTAVTL